MLLLAGLFRGALRGQPLHRLLPQRRHLHGLAPGSVFTISTSVRAPAPEGAGLRGESAADRLLSQPRVGCPPAGRPYWLLPLQLNQIEASVFLLSSCFIYLFTFAFMCSKNVFPYYKVDWFFYTFYIFMNMLICLFLKNFYKTEDSEKSF